MEINKKEQVNHPDHYNAGNIECIDAIEAALGEDGFEAWIVGSVIKYLWRYKHKNGLEDLKKAKWYLDKLIEMISKPIGDNASSDTKDPTNVKPLKTVWINKVGKLCKENEDRLESIQTATETPFEKLEKEMQSDQKLMEHAYDTLKDSMRLLKELTKVPTAEKMHPEYAKELRKRMNEIDGKK